VDDRDVIELLTQKLIDARRALACIRLTIEREMRCLGAERYPHGVTLAVQVERLAAVSRGAWQAACHQRHLDAEQEMDEMKAQRDRALADYNDCADRFVAELARLRDGRT
jgi:hypothetical protein